MTRWQWLLTVGLFLPSAAMGQEAGTKPEDAKTSIPLVLHATGEPRPALKYVLLPPRADRKPGNAAVWWNRIPAEQNSFFNDLGKEGGLWSKIDKWMQVPLNDPKAKELRAGWELQAETIFRDMDRAARFEHCDWQLPLEDGIAMLLPELQQTRSFGRLLSAKARIEISRGRFDDAVRTLQTGYALSRHVAEGQTLIHGLVGIAISSIMSNQVREFIQQPGAPNLYWALATLPRPLIDGRKGLESEMELVYMTIPELREVRSKDRSPEEWRNSLVRLLDRMSRLGMPPEGASAASPLAAVVAINGYPRAKQGLIDRGRPREEVEAMPIPQVILLYTVETYEEIRDEGFKWMLLPYSESHSALQRWEKELGERAKSREVLPLASLLLPAVNAARLGVVRNDRDLAALQACEAIRLYAAAHDGRLPERLSDMDVPVPANPITGQPFAYRRTGETAVLEVSGFPGDPQRWRSFQYEIKIAPKGK